MAAKNKLDVTFQMIGKPVACCAWKDKKEFIDRFKLKAVNYFNNLTIIRVLLSNRFALEHLSGTVYVWQRFDTTISNILVLQMLWNLVQNS